MMMLPVTSEAAMVVVAVDAVVDIMVDVVKLVEDLKEEDEEVEAREEAVDTLTEEGLVDDRFVEVEGAEVVITMAMEDEGAGKDEDVEDEVVAAAAAAVLVQNCHSATRSDMNQTTRMRMRIVSENDGETRAPSRQQTESACVMRNRLVARGRFCQVRPPRLQKIMMTKISTAVVGQGSSNRSRHLGIFDQTHREHRLKI